MKDVKWVPKAVRYLIRPYMRKRFAVCLMCGGVSPVWYIPTAILQRLSRESFFINSVLYPGRLLLGASRDF